MTRLVPACALALLALPAQADDLDRYREASLTLQDTIRAFVISRVPEAEAVMPVQEWTPEIEAVATCTLDGVRAERGDAGVEEYLAAMEEMAAIEMSSFASMGAAPPVLGDDLSMRLMDECGGAEVAAAQAGPLMELMMDPEVMQRLMAP